MKEAVITIMEQHPAMVLLIVVTILLMVSMTICDFMRNRYAKRRTDYIKSLTELMRAANGGKKK